MSGILLSSLLLGASSGLLALLLVPVARGAARAVGVVDVPGDSRRMHCVPTPRAGGVAIFAACAVALGVASQWPETGAALDVALVRPLAVGAAILLLVGLADDAWGLRPGAKLAGQVAAACAAYALGFHPVLPLVHGEAWNAIAFVLWTVGVTNAYNLIDGLDGLAGSVAVVALGTVGVYATQYGNAGVLVPTMVLAGALLGFLRYNVAPASVFLGDAGSLFVGFSLALLTVAGAQRGDGTTNVLLPLCALPMPLLDMAASISRRWLRRQPVFSPDAQHIHHRLVALGYGPRGVATIVYLVSSAIAAFGVVVAFSARSTAMMLGAIGGTLLLWFLPYGCSRLAYHEFVEALGMLLGAPRRARKVIRSQILVRDLLRELERAADPVELRRTLRMWAVHFEFAEFDLIEPRRWADVGPPTPETWLVLCPLAARDATGAPIALLVRSAMGPVADGGTAERVAMTVGREVSRLLRVRHWAVEFTSPWEEEARPVARAELVAPAGTGRGRAPEWSPVRPDQRRSAAERRAAVS